MGQKFFRCIISSRDPCERALINLATARTEYSPGEAAAGVSHSFSIVTYQRGYLIQVNDVTNSDHHGYPVQAASDRDLHDWLYAINPLLAGQIKSKVNHPLFAAINSVSQTGRARPQANGTQANGRAGGARGSE